MEIIINGTDDTFAPSFFRGYDIGTEFIKKINYESIEPYQTGTSTLTVSGIKIITNYHENYSKKHLFNILQIVINKLIIKELKNKESMFFNKNVIKYCKNNAEKYKYIIEKKIPYFWFNINKEKIRKKGILLIINNETFIFDFENHIEKINID
jgi:hypothetical protein